MRTTVFLGAVLALVATLTTSSVLAESAPTPALLDPTQDIRQNLAANQGRYAVVMLRSGGELRGKIGRIGDGLVEITRVRDPGDYFDALVEIGDISAIALQVRGFRK